ncbi:MAG: hypothetical protein BWK72_20170 [Rhodoferax ferrireducens]|uniref:Uncharacterized protein n=1 Tax=Rhodoferax ferrireducens TaxID=192843 RepID=A0A1W9KNY6_9BURK|nr:MAG: hypothetical protein BWK72_20170 [Rhodoferax ferrireducens]
MILITELDVIIGLHSIFCFVFKVAGIDTKEAQISLSVNFREINDGLSCAVVKALNYTNATFKTPPVLRCQDVQPLLRETDLVIHGKRLSLRHHLRLQ